MWSIADQLRGPYKPHQYGDVILPMTILRRLNGVLSTHRDAIDEVLQATDSDELREIRIRQKTGLGFYNATPWTFTRLLGDPQGLHANLVDYISGFSRTIDVFDRFKFEDQIEALGESNRLLIVMQRFAEVDLSPAALTEALKRGLNGRVDPFAFAAADIIEYLPVKRFVRSARSGRRPRHAARVPPPGQPRRSAKHTSAVVRPQPTPGLRTVRPARSASAASSSS